MATKKYGLPTTVRLNPKTIEKLRKIGEKEDRKLSYLIQKAVEEYLERRAKK